MSDPAMWNWSCDVSMNLYADRSGRWGVCVARLFTHEQREAADLERAFGPGVAVGQLHPPGGGSRPVTIRYHRAVFTRAEMDAASGLWIYRAVVAGPFDEVTS